MASPVGLLVYYFPSDAELVQTQVSLQVLHAPDVDYGPSCVTFYLNAWV